MDIAERLTSVRARIVRACERSGRSPSGVTLVAVSKGVGPKPIREAYENGVRDFGESRVQEAVPKWAELGDIRSKVRLHMIGHLQRNKVAPAVTLFDTIQTIDSIPLAVRIEGQSYRTMPGMLEVNISGEAAKHGFSPADLRAAYESISRLTKTQVTGLMTVAREGAGEQELRETFRMTRTLVSEIGLRDISMGMTDDFEIAVEEGATMVRIGRGIFGERIPVGGEL